MLYELLRSGTRGGQALSYDDETCVSAARSWVQYTAAHADVVVDVVAPVRQSGSFPFRVMVGVVRRVEQELI